MILNCLKPFNALPAFIVSVCISVNLYCHAAEDRPLVNVSAEQSPLSNTSQPRLSGSKPSRLQIASSACAATVGVYCHNQDGRYYGSGFVVSSDGYILSSTTAIPAGSEDIKVYFPDHTRLPGKLVASFPELETVVLKVDPGKKKLPVLSLSTDLPLLGAPGYTVGNSGGMIKLGDGASFSAGLISGIYTVQSADSQSGYHGQVIETDAAVTPGQDGGPLLDVMGNVCGIISRSYSTSRFQGTAIPLKLILPKIKPLISGNLSVVKTAAHLVQEAAPAPFLKQSLKALVGVEVERDYRPETIIREDWGVYRLGLKDWYALAAQKQRRLEADFFAADTLLGANQIIRRPDAPVTGILISPDGYILTSAFNVQSGDMVFLQNGGDRPQLPRYAGDVEKIKAGHSSSYRKELNRVRRVWVILPGGEKVSAAIHGFDLNLGLALLKVDVEGALPFLDISAASQKPSVGQAVRLLGVNTSGSGCTVNGGIISALGRDNGKLMQFDALLNYGNSGGPVVDGKGDFLGMALAPVLPAPIMGKIIPFRNPQDDPGTLSLSDFRRFPNNGISFAVCADKINEAIGRMLQGKGVLRRSVTVAGFEPTKKSAFSSRVVVGKVAQDSPAWKSGLREGDELVSFEGMGIRSWKEFTNMVQQKNPGDITELVVRRPLQKPYLQIGQKKLHSGEDVERYLGNLRDGEKISAVYHCPSVKLTVMLVLQKGR